MVQDITQMFPRTFPPHLTPMTYLPFKTIVVVSRIQVQKTAMPVIPVVLELGERLGYHGKSKFRGGGFNKSSVHKSQALASALRYKLHTDMLADMGCKTWTGEN